MAKELIEIRKNGTRVEIVMRTGLYQSDEVIILDCECNNNIFADLLQKQLNEKMNEVLRAIREQEYNIGWKDAKRHNKKRDWHPSPFQLIDNY